MLTHTTGIDSISGHGSGSFSFSSRASLSDAGTTSRLNDDYTISGNARLSFGGSASESSRGSATTVIHDDTMDANIHSAAMESMFGSMDGSTNVEYTLTNHGERVTGSYSTSMSGSSRSASQSNGTVTDKSDPENHVTTPVRDNQAGSSALSVTARGSFRNDSLSPGLPAERSASGHVTRSETSGSRFSRFAEVAGPVEGQEEPIIVPQRGGYSLSKGTFERTYRADYNFSDTNGSLSRRGTFQDDTRSTGESSLSLAAPLEEAGTTGKFSLRSDGGTRNNTTGIGSISAGPNGRTVSSSGSQDLENFGAAKTSLTRNTTDTSGNRSGSTGTSDSKSKTASNGTGSSTTNGVDEMTGSNSSSSTVDARQNGGGSDWSRKVNVFEDEGITTATRTAMTSSGSSQSGLTGGANGKARRSRASRCLRCVTSASATLISGAGPNIFIESIKLAISRATLASSVSSCCH